MMEDNNEFDESAKVPAPKSAEVVKKGDPTPHEKTRN